MQKRQHNPISLKHETLRLLAGSHLRLAGGEPNSTNCDTGHESVAPYACTSGAICGTNVCQTQFGPCG